MAVKYFVVVEGEPTEGSEHGAVQVYEVYAWPPLLPNVYPPMSKADAAEKLTALAEAGKAQCR